MGAAGAATDPGEASGGGVSCNPRWHVVHMSGSKRRDTTLFGLSGTSAANLWAVGYRYVSGKRAPFIEHWNGHRWAVTPSPKIKGFIGGYTELQGVAGNSASDAWAVGFREVPTGRRSRTLIEHWDGQHWRIQASPNMTDGRNDLHAVTVISSHDAWAVGGWIPAQTGDWRQLVLHWDGTAWTISRTSLTGELLSASAGADGGVWAGGYESGTDAVVVHEAGKRRSNTPAVTPLTGRFCAPFNSLCLGSGWWFWLVYAVFRFGDVSSAPPAVVRSWCVNRVGCGRGAASSFAPAGAGC
jgi:hypothetical protein